MRRNPYKVDVHHKEILTVEQCAALTGISQARLKAMLSDPKCTFCLKMGSRRMILRNKLIEYLERKKEI